MAQFYVINESTEDTVDSSDSLEDAIRIAREAASQGQAGDPVCILESGGTAIRQFMQMPDGTVAEQPIARQVRR